MFKTRSLKRQIIIQFVVILLPLLPGMDGLEATRQIRSRFAQLELPIIAHTANAMGGDRERCLECGMDDYLSKPFKKEQLQAMVSKWIKADV